MDKKRNDVWDIAKGLGILFVVAGHGFSGGISQFVNLFHIPLFFYLSGLVFRFQDKSMKSAITFIYKRMKSLWLPSVLYGCFYVMLHNAFVAVGIYALDKYSIKQFFVALAKNICFLKTEPLESAMWFLTAIFIGGCLLYGVLWISSFFKRKLQNIIEVILVILFFSMGCFFFYKQISLPGNADNACSLLPFMYAGYRMKKIEYRRHYLAVPCVAIMTGILFFTGETLRMSRNEIVNPGFLLVAGFSGVLLTLELADHLKKWKVGKVFSYLGRNTIPILCLHLLAFRSVSFIWVKAEGLPLAYISRHPIVESSYVWGGFYTLIGILVPLIVPIVKNRLRISKGYENG